MREIIVGRQLGLIEQRLQRLENHAITRVESTPSSSPQVEELEARFEAVRDSMQHQVDQIRLELGGEMNSRKQEVRRLAEQIQQAVQAKIVPQAAVQEVAASESRLIAWVSAWQKGLEQHLAQRESWLIGQFRNELQRIAQSPNAPQVDPREVEAQEKIAATAQALAAAASALSQLHNSFPPKS